MNRLEKITQAAQQKESRFRASVVAEEQVRKGQTELANREMERLRSVIGALGIQGQLEEIRDTVWQMGSIEALEDLGTRTVGLGLVAEWSAYSPGIAGYSDRSQHSDPDYDKDYWNPGIPPSVVSDGRKIWVKATSEFPEKENLNDVKITVADTAIAISGRGIHPSVIERVDTALTDVCLETGNVREIALTARKELIEHIRAGEISRQQVPQEFQQYLPPPEPPKPQVKSPRTSVEPPKRRGLLYYLVKNLREL